MYTGRQHSELRQGGVGWSPSEAKGDHMLIPAARWDVSTFPNANGVNPGSSGYGGIDLGQPHEDLRALEADIRGSTVTKGAVSRGVAADPDGRRHRAAPAWWARG